MDCKHINFVINKISTDKITVRRILCEIIKHKLNEKKKKEISIENNDISQKIQTIFIFLMLQLYTFKTLCDVPHNKFNNILYRKLNKISSNLTFFKKLFHFAIDNVPLNELEKKMTYLMYTWFKKIILNICEFNSKINRSHKKNKHHDIVSDNDNCSMCSKKSSDTSNDSEKNCKNTNQIENIKKYSIDKISEKVYSDKFIKSIYHIQIFIEKLITVMSILNKNIENKIGDLQSNNHNVVFSNYNYELINKMIFVTFIHIQYISKKLNFLIKNLNIDTKKYYHMIDKINIQGIYNISTKCKYHSCHLNNKTSHLVPTVDSYENEKKRDDNGQEELFTKRNNNFITIAIGNDTSKIEFINHNSNIENIIETLLENKLNIENTVRLLNMNNQVAQYFTLIVSNYETCE